ncbi:hypothetical protein ACIRTB_13195 [Streptomyces sp. NPDC101158]|uniref:hypothetical protein n=1 Tax=Streptomyces sp. NPDC101158 TaxID=3366117 RepID=UPI00380322D6
MSASDNSHQNPSRRTGPHAVPDAVGTPHGADRAVPAEEASRRETTGSGQAATGALHALPAPFAEKARAAGYVARGTGGMLWTAVRHHKAVAGGAAVSATAALTGAYALGHRAGRRSRGPLARLLGGRF